MRRKPSGAAPAFEGHLLAVPLPRGRYGAIQVLPSGGEGKGLTAVALDGFWERVPTLEEAAATAPLSYHHRPGEVCAIHASEAKPPRRFVDLGAAPLRPVPEVLSYASAYGFRTWIELERRWRHERTESERATLRAARWSHDTTPVEVRLGPATLVVRRDSSQIRIGPPEVPPDARIDWAALDELPHLTALDYAGNDRGVLAFAARRLALNRLGLWPDAASLDLTPLRVRTLTIGAGVTELGLGAAVDDLTLVSPRPELRVVHPEDGAELSLTVLGPRELPPAIQGLARLRSYAQGRLRQARVAELLGYAQLESLRLDGAPGALEDVASLAKLPALDVLTLHDLYDLDAFRFPRAEDAPSLSDVRIWGFRASSGKELRKRLAGYWMWELTGGKKDEWLAENADNPFRDWVDRSASLGKKACALYRDALRALRAAPDEAAVRESLVAFVEGLNTLDRRHGFDTIDRETSGEAFERLLAAVTVAVDREALERVFDERRDF